MSYIAIIHKDKDSDWGVCFPDFPGCISAGNSVEEARDLAKEALTAHIELMVEEGMDIPRPSKWDEIMKQPDFADGLAFLVEPSTPSKFTLAAITPTDSSNE